MNLGAWNVRTLLDLEDGDRPERRTALVCKELARFSIDIAALSETRLSDEGRIDETGSGYSIFWKGKPAPERRIHGVGFAIKTTLVRAHNLMPKAINERLITLRIPLPRGNFLTLISVYAPTLDSEETVKEEFYQQLNELISSTPPRDKLIILGDFNARIGNDSAIWSPFIGKQGHGNCNDNGLRLLGTCAEHDLLITNTIFQLPTRQKTTWMHPRSKLWHTLDYSIVRLRDRRDVLITRSMPGADDCWTDHRLVVTKLNMTTCKHPSIQHSGAKRLDTLKLKDPDMAKKYAEAVQRAMPHPANQITEEWLSLRETMNKAAIDTIGYKKRRQQNWFDDNDQEISELIDAKRRAKIEYESHPSSQQLKSNFLQLKARCQRVLRNLQNSWWIKKAEELQQYADARNMRSFFSGVKEVFGPIRSSTSTLKAADNITELTEPQDILARWQDHFSTLLNRDSSVAPDCLRNVPQHPVRLWMSAIPTYTEFETALKSIQPYKAPGPDNIPLELIKHGGLPLQTRIYHLLLRIWENEEIPADLKDANIITIFKKGDRSVCGNYRGISLLSITGKMLARILLNRLLTLSEDILPESQCGFRPNRGTIDMIFCARQSQEKCREHQQPLGMIFYDLEKAFDSIPRSAMWQVLERFGCPEKFTTLVRSLHDGMLGRVQHQTGLSEPFPITGGLKQGCVLAPTLFSIYLAAMLHEIPENNPGIGLRYRMDGGLFNIARLRSRNRTNPMQLSELQYADDNCTIAHTLEDLQDSADNFSRAYSQFGLNINIAKTKVLLQPRPGHHTPPEDKITIRGLELENVDHFTYLGSILDVNATAERDVNNRIRAAHTAYGKLHSRVFSNPGLTQNTKLMVYQAVVISTLLYACETWVLYRKDTVKLERFHQSKLRQILRIKWQDRVTNNEVLLRARAESIEATITRHRLRWAGHLARMYHNRLPKQVLFSELDSGNRPRGAPKRRFKDQLKHTLKAVDIDPINWEAEAANRESWRRTIREKTETFENNRRQQIEVKRNIRKARAENPQNPPTFPCGGCGRLFRAQIGLISHRRRCQ